MTSSASPRAASPRSSRRQMLIKVAGELFHERAFDAVTTEMIGARAGVTGPALYRHFPSKQALLIAVLEDPLNDLLAHARTTAAEVTDPRRALESMIDYHVAGSLQNVPSTLVFLKNEHNVPEDDRHRMRRMMRLYAEEWSGLLERLRPDLSDAQNRVLTHAVFSMINSVPQFNSGLDPESVATTVRTAAINALLIPAGTV